INLQANNSKVSLDKSLLIKLITNDYFIPFFLLGIFKLVNIKKIKLFTLTLFKELKSKKTSEEIDVLFNKLMEPIKKNFIDFKEKINFLSLLVILVPSQNIILKHIMNALIMNKENINTHYAILTNTSFYKNVDNLSLYEGFYKDRRQIRDNIKNYIIKDLDIKFNNIENHSNEKTIAIIAHQLLSMLHSPTKMLIKYVNFLKKEYPEYKIKIFVEDNFIHKSSELFFPYAYSSTWAKNLNEEHLNELNNDIDIYYSDPQCSRKQRTIHLVNEVNKFNPELVWAFGPLSIALDILYEYYPTMYISISSGSYFAESADVHLYKDKTFIIKTNEKLNLLDEDKIYERMVINAHSDLKPYKNIDRTFYQIKNKDFVMITVGNRLDAELDNVFIDNICNFIVNNKNVKWIIVGRAKLKYLNDKYENLLNNKIVTISYEDDLSALYRICDVYINPVRVTGGTSVAIALNSFLPVVTLDKPSDVRAVIGKNNTYIKNLKEYINELENLYKNVEYKNKKINDMKLRLEQMDYKIGIEKMVNFFSIAKENSKKRFDSL
ncbi:MAG: glycosyltransferase, partial [Bacillota bacterium]